MLALELGRRSHAIIGCSHAQDKLNSLQSKFSASLDSNPTSSDKYLLLNANVRSNSNVEELARIMMDAGIINKNNKISGIPLEKFDALVLPFVTAVLICHCEASIFHISSSVLFSHEQDILFFFCQNLLFLELPRREALSIFHSLLSAAYFCLKLSFSKALSFLKIPPL